MSIAIRPVTAGILVFSLGATSAVVAKHKRGWDSTPTHHISQHGLTARTSPPVKMVIWTDRTKYMAKDIVQLNVLLRNEGNSTVYVSRRMAGFWDGGNLGMEISDDQGNRVPLPFASHVPPPPPPPKKGDDSVLLPLEAGYSYGTWMELLTKDFFRDPGKYSIRMTYHNWLPEDFIPRRLHGQPVLGADTPPIVSEPLWIEITK